MTCSTYPSGVSSIVSRPLVFLSLALPLILAACGPGDRDAAWRGDSPKAPADAPADAGYLAPPTLSVIKAEPDGTILLTGQAEPGSIVRLGSPTGEAFTANVSPAGVWSLSLEPSDQVQMFGLSMSKAKRQVQSQGYLAILPGGRAAQLRAGASAYVYGGASDAPQLLTVDFDRTGAASISGTARADGGGSQRIDLRIDRVPRGRGNVDSQGRFHMSVEKPLNAGAQTFEVAGDSGEQAVIVPISGAPDLAGPPQASRIARAWRIDWMTPGGGVQSTLILDPTS